MNMNDIIPGFDLLSSSEQAEFLGSSDGLLINALIAQAGSAIADIRAARSNLKENQIINIQSQINRRESIRTLKQTILRRRIIRICPGFALLEPQKQQYLIDQPYTQVLLNNNSIDQDKTTWFNGFNQDQSNEARQIQDALLTQYNKSFGFLFKTEHTQRLHDLAETLSTERSEAKQDVLQQIKSDWNIQRKLINTLSTQIESSLVWLLKNPTKITKEYADKIANAHAVYRFFGLSSDNGIFGISIEGVPFANLIDLYNYHKHREGITEALNVWQTLKIPLNPFFEEYIEIGKFEKNPLMICLRAFIPFLIMASFLTMGYSLVLPLAVHQFIEYVLFIPTLYLAIAVASLYIEVRNIAYAQILGFCYGSVYFAPPFQANQRIKEAFSNPDMAHQVATYYAHCLQNCDRVESRYAARHGALTNQELVDRNENLKLKYDLYLEWYDLHDRQDIGTDKIPTLVMNRLQTDLQRLSDQIEQRSTAYINTFKPSFFPNEQFKERFDEIKAQISTIEHLMNQINTDQKLDFSFC